MCLIFLLTSFLLIMLLEKLHSLLAQRGVVYVDHLWASCANLHRLSLPHVIKGPEACCETAEEESFECRVDYSSHSTFMHCGIEMTSSDHDVRVSWTVSFHFLNPLRNCGKIPLATIFWKFAKMVWLSLFLLGLSFMCTVGPTVFH